MNWPPSLDTWYRDRADGKGNRRPPSLADRPDQVAPFDEFPTAALHVFRIEQQLRLGELRDDLLRRQVCQQRLGEQTHDREVVVGSGSAAVTRKSSRLTDCLRFPLPHDMPSAGRARSGS